MAIKYKLSNTNITNEAGNKLQLQDITGNYDATTNTGGYGLPNATRSSVALFITGSYVTSTGILYPISFSDYDPITATTFTANLTKDGWYRFNLVPFSIYDNSQLSSYDEGDIYYDATNDVLVKIVLGVALPIDITSLIGLGYEQESIDSFIVYNSCKTKIRLNSMISDLLTNNVDFANKKLIRLKDNYNLVRAILQGALYEFCRGNKSVAQKNIEFLNSNNYVSE